MKTETETMIKKKNHNLSKQYVSITDISRLATQWQMVPNHTKCIYRKRQYFENQ